MVSLAIHFALDWSEGQKKLILRPDNRLAILMETHLITSRRCNALRGEVQERRNQPPSTNAARKWGTHNAPHTSQK